MKGHHNLLSRSTTSSTSSPSTLTTFASSSLSLTGSSGSGSSASSASSSSLPLLLSSLQLTLPKCIHTFQVFHTSTTSSVQALLSLFSQLSPLLQRLDEYRDHLPLNRVQRIVRLVSSLHALVTHVRGLALRFLGDCGNTTFLELLRQGEQVVHLNDALETEFADVLQALEQRLRDLTRAMQDGAFLSLLDRPKRPADVCRHPTAKVFWARHFGTARRVKWNAFVAAYLHEFGRLTLARQGLLRKAMGIGSGWEIDVQHLADFTDQLGIPESFNALVHLAESLVDHVALQWPDNMPLRTVLEHIAAKLEIDANHRGNLPARVSETVTMFERNFFFTAGDLRREQDTVWESLLAMDVPFRLASRLRHEIFNVNVSDVYIVNASVALTMLNIKSHAQADFSTGVPSGLIADLDRIASLSVHPDHHSKYRTFLTAYKVLPAVLLILEKLRALSRIRDFDDESEQCASAVVRALVNLTEFGLLNSPHVRMELGNSVRHVPPAQRLAAAIIPSCVATFLGFNNTPRLRKVLQEAISVMLDNPLLSSSEAALLFDALCCETVDELRSSGISSRPLSRLQQTIAMSPPRISRSDTFAGMLRPPNPDDPSLSPALGGLTVTVEEAALSELLVAVDQAAEHTSLSNGFAADRFGLRDGYGTPRHSRQSSGNSSEGGDEDSNSGSGSADSNTLSPRVSHRKQAPSFGDIKLVAASSRSLLLAEVEHEVDEHVAFDAMSDSFMLTVCARVLEEHHNRVAALDRHVGSTVLAASAYMARPWRRMVGELSRSSKLGAHSRHSSREDISERTLLSHSDSTFKPGSFSFSQYSLLPNGDWFYPEDESRGIVLAFHRGNIYGRAVASLASSSSCDCDVIVLRGVYSKEPDEWRWRFNLQYCEVRVERTGHVATNEPRLHTGTITYDKTIERFVLEAKDSAEEFIWYSRVQVPEDKLHTIENKRAQVEKTRLEQLLANPQRSRLGRIGKTPRRSRSQTGMSHVSMSDDSINTLQLAAAGRPRSKSRGGYSSPDRSSGSGSGLSGSASPQLPRRSITAGKTTKMPSFDLSGTTALTSAVSMVVGGKLTRWGRRAVEQLFTFFDGDGDGRLNPSELVVMSLACGTASVDRSALVDADLPDLYAFYEFHGERRLLEDMLTSRAAFALFDSHTGKISKLGLALSGYLHDVVQFFYARSRGSRYLFARKWMAAYRDSPIDDIGEYVEHRGEVILQHELHLIGALPLVDLEAEAHMAQGTCTSVQQQQSAASPTARDSSSNSGSEASPRPRRRPSGVRAAPFLAQVPSASDFLRPLHKYHFVGYSCVTCSTPKSHLICRACARCCHVDHALKGPYFVGSVRDASSLLRCRCDNRKQATMRTSLQVDLDAREDELVKHETGAHTDLTMFPLLDGSVLAAQASRGAAKEPAVESFWHRAPCQLPAGRFRMSRRNSVDEQVPYDHPFFTSSSTDGLFELAQRHCDYIKTARRAYLRKKRNRAIGDGGSPSLSLHDAHSSADNVVVCVSVKWDVDLQRATRDGLEVSLVVVAPNNIVVDYTHPSERDKLAGVKVLTHWSERGNMRMVGFNPSVADGTYTICVVARPSRANPQPNDPDRLTSFHSIRHDSGMRAIVAQRDRAPLARVAWLSNAAAQGHPLDQRVWYVGAIVMKDGEVRSARLFEQLVPRLMFNHAFDSEVWRPMFYNDQKMHSPLRDEDLKMKAYQNMALNALKPASLRKHLRVSPDLYLTTAVSALRLLRSCHPISMAHLHKIITFLSIDIFSPFIREKKKKAAHTTQKPRRNGGSGKPEAGRFVGGSARPKQDDSTTRPGYIPVSDLVLPPALASEFVRYLDCCLSTACRKPSHAEYFQYVAHLCSLGGRFGPRMLLAFLKFKVMPAMVDSAPLIKWVCYLCKRFMSECGWRGRLLVAEIFDSDDVVSSPSPRVPVPEDSTAAARLGSGKVWDRMSFGNLSTSLWSFKQALQHAAHLEDTALVVDLLNLLLALVEMHLPADPLARKLLLRSLSSTAERNRVHTHAGLATPPFSPNATPRTPEDDDDSSDSDSGRMPLSTVRRFVSNEIEENSDDEGEPVGTIERIIDAGIPFDLVELVFPLRHPLVHSLLFRVLRRLLQYDRGLDADARHGLALLITQQTSFMAYASLGIEEVEENAKHVPADQTDRCLFLAYLFSVTGQQGLHFLNALPEHVAVRLRRKLSCVTDVASPVENGTRMSRSETMSGVDTLYSQNWEEAQRQVFERYDGLVNSLAARKWSSRRVEELLAGKAPSPRPVHQPTRFGSQGRVHGRPGTVSEAGRDDALGDDLIIQDEVVLRQGPVKTQTGFFFKTWSTRWLILTPVALFAARDKDWNGKRLLARLNEFSSVRVPRQHDDLGFDLRYANGDDPLRLQALSPGLRDEWVTQITAALTGEEG